MSEFVCDGHGQQIRGRLVGAYGALVIDGQRLHNYRRLCRDCVTDLIARHKREWRESFLSEDSREQHCCHCCGAVAENLSALRRFYGTVYVDHKSRHDYRAYYCDDCADLIREELALHV
jgi:hypothetical protein